MCSILPAPAGLGLQHEMELQGLELYVVAERAGSRDDQVGGRQHEVQGGQKGGRAREVGGQVLGCTSAKGKGVHQGVQTGGGGQMTGVDKQGDK